MHRWMMENVHKIKIKLENIWIDLIMGIYAPYKEYELEGAKLNKLTQKLAYMHIQEQKQIKALTPTGEKNMEETRKQIEETLGVYPSEKQYGMG